VADTSLLAQGSPIRRWGPWLAVFVVAVAVLSVAAFGSRNAPTAQDRVNAITHTIKCPVCAGESVAVSDAPASQEIRRQIAEQVQQGQSDDQIRSFYAAKYTQAILLTPSASGLNLVVWILPVVALAVAIAALVIVFRRWSNDPGERSTDADRELVEAALQTADPEDPHGEGASR
jgi:cytochrome c-type biogenesis protein CcmH